LLFRVSSLTGFNVFNAAYYQKFNDQVEVAYRASWNHKVSSLSMEIGAKYFLATNSTTNFIKTKLDNAGRLGLALATDLRPGVQLNLGASVDTAKLNEDAHKFGVELNYSA
jgi:voltage-dependent anion channel protein 2